MVLFHGKTIHPASLFRQGQLTTHNPCKGEVDIYRADGHHWVKVASWNKDSCQYLDNTGKVFEIK